MSLIALFSDLSAHLNSPEFLQAARHPLHPRAFTRSRKLPLPALVSLLLTGMRKSVQAELDEFFAHLNQKAQLVRHVSAQAFALARAKLSVSAIPDLNDWVIRRAEHYGFVSLWNGLRLVAADASTIRFSGLSQQAVAQDVAAKVLCDNLQALTALTARDDAQLPTKKRINHAYVFTALKPLLPALLLGKKAVKLMCNVLKLVAKQTYRHVENLAKPRKSRPKPHKHMTQKNC